MDTAELMDAARIKFEKGLWHSSGWGGENGLEADRRCIVGTFRWIAGTGSKEAISHRQEPVRSPWFFAYEEGIFETVSILFENPHMRAIYGWTPDIKANGFNPVQEVRLMQREYGCTEHKAILFVLDHAEGALMSYNDGSHSSTLKMMQLMDKAVARVKAKRAAIAAEYELRDDEEVLTNAVDPTKVTVASDDDARKARDEYEAKHGKTWDPWTHDSNGNPLPPLWAFDLKNGWSTKGLRSRAGGKLTKTY
jgi:hypothetical protein